MLKTNQFVIEGIQSKWAPNLFATRAKVHFTHINVYMNRLV